MPQTPVRVAHRTRKADCYDIHNPTVEYTDPNGLFPLVQSVIEAKLPLKNLHWKSPTRPVRSIESLRIGFVPAQSEASERKSSSDAAHARASTSAPPHRRHQIPGLRQTPYLKVYLLRCDDNESYKTTARRVLREWIKTHASSSSSSQSTTTSQEKHDACEWLILHVVPDSEPVDKTPAQTSKWGRGTTTVLEKIKADFNGSSKSAVDRVAQLKLPKEGTAKPHELADQLEDLIDKMKNGILASFDLRVAQYEEDIKEKDSQRSLPGWNFCMFFILKEGLARGFENVGLFEDALVGYDELAVGLDSAVRDQLQGSGDQHGGALLTSSKSWAENAKKALDADVPPENGDTDEKSSFPELQPEDFPLDASKMQYREMILASDISIFDFRTYIFSRQLTLLLRAARAPSLGSGAGDKNLTKPDKPEDLRVLAEICGRSTEFISLAARTLRSDLECGLADITNDAKTDIINNMVSGWAYSAAFQILNQTFSSTLTLPDSSTALAQTSDGPISPAAMADSRPGVPRRTSSLISSTGSHPSRPVTQDMSSESIGLLQRRQTMDHLKTASTQKTGSEDLASGRGDLLLLARRSLEEMARRRGWGEKWDDLGLLFDDRHRTGADDLADVSLDDNNAPQQQEKPEVRQASLIGVELPALQLGLKSKTAYLALYEDLTDRMMRHHLAANRAYSAEMTLSEIALLRFRQQDYETAASYFQQMAPFYGSKHWVVIEGSMLELHTRCLKELKRSEEYVRTMLRLLANFAAYLQAQLTVKQKTLAASTSFMEQELLAGYVSGLFDASQSLQKEVSASLTDFFADLHVNPAIQLFDDKDGFQLQLSLRFLLGQQVDIDSIKVRLVSAGTAQHAEHWIESSRKSVVKSTTTKILIDSLVSGPFSLADQSFNVFPDIPSWKILC